MTDAAFIAELRSELAHLNAKLDAEALRLSAKPNNGSKGCWSPKGTKAERRHERLAYGQDPTGGTVGRYS